ncbi:hypothetical protein C7G91_10260 [Acinetobacter nosocomialis]|nr:ESPR-type extended signal peptide-containing protein [Acinetobacter nosocomialis]PSE45666.1 hypothetical protein C7G97_02270 [Acinetobacter nosocomialis]PSE82665.1 hypothetical protein C7G91_10260 [Acinetobacter nosocomialis]
MNKIYKVIWNASLGIWVAVSEIAKGHSKTRSQRTNNALMPSTEATDFLQSSTSINFKIKPLTWGILTVLVPSITFGEVGVSGGFATGNNATAISACTGTGVGGTGDRATAGGERALAIGCGAVTDSDRDIAIGSQASTANPANATGTYNESIAIGAESRASGSQALAIGGQATATGNSSVAIGADDMDKVASTNPPAYNYTPTAGDNALYNNTATAATYKNLTGDYLVDFEKTNGGASGVGNRYTRVQTGEAAVAVGPKATATDLGTALGPVATAGSIASVAVGVKAEARGQGSLSIGSLAYTANTGDVAVGINSAATGGDSIAIGAGSDLKGTPYVQSGASASKKGASASGANSISIGTNTAATGTNAVVVGTQSTASNLAVAVGSVATAGDQSVSIGSNSAASSQTSVAIGVRAQTLQTNSVALGSDSVADRASGSLGYDPLTETSTTNTNSTWKATDAAVSVGNGTTRTRQITSVAAGTNDTDAANVAQLKKATSKVLAGTGTTVAQGTDSNGITTYTVNANTFTVRQGTTNKATIGDSTTDKVSFINGKNTVAKVADELNSNTDVTFDLADDISLNSVITGNTTLNSSGVTVNGGANGPVKLTNTGLDNGGNKITNVAAGTISASSTDAVNGSQLNTTNQNVTTAQNTANTAVTNAAAAQNTANTAVTNAATAQATADKGLNFSVNGGTVDNVKLGETVNFADGINTTAVYDPATNTYKYNVNDNIALTNAGSLTVGNTKVDNSGLTITGGPSVTTAGINAGNQKITNVAAGTLSSTSTDAVNGSQLDATNQNVTTAQNTANTAVSNAAAAQATADKGLNFSVNGGTADNVKLGETVNFADGTNTTAVYDPATNTYKYNVNDNIALTNAGSLTVGNTKVDNSGLTIAGGPGVTTAGINAGNQKITNVAAGTNATDAVNVSQLGAVTTAANTKTDALGTSTAGNLGGGAVYNPVTGAVSSPIYSVNGNNVNNVGDAITALDKGWTLQSNGANAGAVKAGDTVDIGTVAGESNLKVTKSGNKIQYGLNRDLNVDSVTAGNSKLDTNGLTITGGPSVTTAGINAGNQKITNVAAGTISASSTDAVNGSQLNTTNQNVTTAQNTANTAVTNAAAAQATADKGLNFSVNGGTADNVKLGETVNFADGTNTTAVYDPATYTYKYNVNDNIALTNAGSLTVGNTKVDNSGLTITGGPSVTTAGINAGNQKITNVAAGTNATDAVNVSQLGAVTTAANTKTDALGTSTASNLGGGAVYNPVTGAVSSPIYSVNGNNVNNVGDAITALDKGWTLQSNGANAGAVKAGDTVDIGTVAGESNLKVTKTGNKIQYGLNRDLNIDNVTAGESKLDTNGLTIAGGPSVTKSGIDAASQKITNVAAGTVSATSTDAVNGSQLHTLDSRVTKNGDSIANIFGGGAKANPDGSISNPSYKVAGTSANNVGDALTALDKAVTDAGTAANTGWTVLANGDAATAKKIKPNGKVNFTGDDNLTVAQTSETDNEGNIKVALNKNLKVDSVTTGNTVIDTTGVKVGDNIQLGSTGLIIAGGPSMTTSGINAGNKVITNVAAGVNTTDAVNKGQLDSAITNINNNVGALANSAVQYDKNADGTVNKDSVTFAGGANGTALKNVADGTVAAGSKDAVNGGQLWTVQQQVDKNTGDISNLQTDISNINNGKSGLVQQANKDAAITVGKDTGGTQVNVAGTAGDRTVTGVKAGAVTATSKDAVNGSQLNTTNQALVNYLGGGAGYDNITQSFSNPTYNVGDKSYNNVGDAIGALNQADQTLNTKIDSVTNKLEQAFYSTNQRIDKLEEKMSAGIAANAALENAPFIPGKVTMAVGAAYYNEQNAVGVTLRKTADNGRWSLTTGASLGSQGSPLVRVGVSTVID